MTQIFVETNEKSPRSINQFVYSIYSKEIFGLAKGELSQRKNPNWLVPMGISWQILNSHLQNAGHSNAFVKLRLSL